MVLGAHTKKNEKLSCYLVGLFMTDQVQNSLCVIFFFMFPLRSKNWCGKLRTPEWIKRARLVVTQYRFIYDK